MAGQPRMMIQTVRTSESQNKDPVVYATIWYLDVGPDLQYDIADAIHTLLEERGIDFRRVNT